jgi:hypothetical protein
MVMTVLPATAFTGKMQVRVDWPSTLMEHAPHKPIPQPNLLPFSLK